MREPLMVTLYVAKGVLQDFDDAYFPVDPDDPAAQLKKHEALIEELEELQWVHGQYSAELARVSRCAQSGMDISKLQEAAALAQEETSAKGYHRVAEFYRRLMILRDL